MALCCGTPSVLSQDVYDSILALTSCSTETDGQPEVNNESFLRPFLNMHPSLGIHVAFLSPWNTQELLKAHIPPHISFLRPFLPRLFGLSIACPNFKTLIYLLWQMLLPLYAFSKSHWESYPSHGMLQIGWNTSKLLHLTLRELPDPSKYTTTSLRIRSA